MAELLYRILEVFGYNHPLHPVLTHLVVGPVIAAFIFELIAVIWKRPGLRKTAWHLTLLAVVFWFFTVILGFIDWAHYYNLTRITDITVKIILSGVLLLILVARILLRNRFSAESIIPLILLGLATVNVSVIGFFGGNLVYGGSGIVEAGEVTTSEVGWKETRVEGNTLEWRVVGDSLDVRISYRTTGWIAVGFGTTAQMEGSDIYIGYVTEDGSVVVVDSFGVSPQAHAADVDEGGVDNVTNVTGQVRRGTTTISFTVPLNSGDEFDVVYTPGETYSVILAHAPDEARDTETYHGTDGRLAFELTL